MCRAKLERGEFCPILLDYQLESVDVHAVYRAGRRPSPKVKAFSDYLAAQLAAKDGNDR
jgi:DNA-binding transcriptional LysR family regulator